MSGYAQQPGRERGSGRSAALIVASKLSQLQHDAATFGMKSMLQLDSRIASSAGNLWPRDIRLLYNRRDAGADVASWQDGKRDLALKLDDSDT